MTRWRAIQRRARRSSSGCARMMSRCARKSTGSLPRISGRDSSAKAPSRQSLTRDRPAVSRRRSHRDVTAESAAEEVGPQADAAARRRHPFIWIVWGASVVSLVAFAQAASVLVRDGDDSRVRLDRSASRRRMVRGTRGSRRTSGRPSGRRRSADCLNGVPPFGGGGTRVHRRDMAAGDTYQLAIDRQGRRIEPTLTVAEGPNELAKRLTYFFISLVWCVVGLFIGLARPEHPVARLAFGVGRGDGSGLPGTGSFRHPGLTHSPSRCPGLSLLFPLPDRPPR